MISGLFIYVIYETQETQLKLATGSFGDFFSLILLELLSHCRAGEVPPQLQVLAPWFDFQPIKNLSDISWYQDRSSDEAT